MVFYFHGFASSSNSWKVRHLKENIEGVEIVAPTLPVDPVQVIALFEEHVSGRGKPDLVVGSSLGGFYAYYLSCRFHIPAVLINPSITPWQTLATYVGTHERYDSGGIFEWKASYLISLKQMGQEIAGFNPSFQNLHFFLSSDDEVLDLSSIPARFPNAGSIRFLDNCGHSFSRFPEIVPYIQAMISQ